MGPSMRSLCSLTQGHSPRAKAAGAPSLSRGDDHERAPEGRESNGGPGRIRTFEGISRQIYSLLRLATSLPTQSVLIINSAERKERLKCMGKHSHVQSMNMLIWVGRDRQQDAR